MKIQELKLKHFGKFTDKNIRIEDGVNILLEWKEGEAVHRPMMRSVSMNRGRILTITLEH